jgi:RNA-binding protein
MRGAATPSVVLEGYQRQYLRGLAHDLKPIVHVGDKGVTDEVAAAVGQALLEHELMKVRLHEPEDKQAMAELLAEKCGAVLCGLVGHTLILYKKHPKTPKIKVPVRAAKDFEPR